MKTHVSALTAKKQTVQQQSDLNNPAVLHAPASAERRPQFMGRAVAKFEQQHKKRSRRCAAQVRHSLTPAQRLREPILTCNRCGERYHASWQKDFHCPKCGRRPAKVQPWEGALCALFPPVALISAMSHRQDSPRRALGVLLLGAAGTALDTGIYLFFFAP